MKMLSLLGSLLISFCLLGQSNINTISQDQAYIEKNILPITMILGEESKPETIEGLLTSLNVPGCSVSVVKDGKLHWAKGYGLADIKTNKKVDANTLFQAGSISKPLAALAALTLVEKGDLELDEDITKYLKSWKLPAYEFEEKVTLRMLLTHTAGITVHGFPGYSDKDLFPSINDVLDGQGNTDSIFVDTEPGSTWRYSGGGYTIMEKLVEDASGMALDEYMSLHIFPKLGMSNSTYLQPLPNDRRSNVSLAYNRKGKIIDGSFHHYPEQAAAGLWTTPTDLAKYICEIQAISAGKKNGLIGMDLLSEMLTKHKNDWGLGPSLRDKDGELLFGHGGKNAGFTNNMIATTSTGNGIVIMTSGDAGNEIISKLEIAISEYYDMGISESVVLEILPITKEELARFIGEYAYEEDWNMKVKISVKNGKLNAKFGSKHELEYIGGLTFADIKDPEQVEFQEDEDGNISAFKLKGPGVVFKKVK